MIKLINAKASPFGRKVAIALREKNITYEVQYDIPWNEDSCTTQYNPLEQLPILILENNEVIYDSNFILEWIEFKYPQPSLLPHGTDEVLHTKFVQMLGERLMDIALTIVFELQRAAPALGWIERQKRKLVGGLQKLNDLLETRCPSPEASIDVGDIAVAVTLAQLDFIVANGFPSIGQFNWQGSHPHLKAFAAALESRPSFRDTRPMMMEIDLKAVIS